MTIQNAVRKLWQLFGRSGRSDANRIVARASDRPEYSDQVYAEGVEKFEAGNPSAALQLFSQYLRMTNRGSLLSTASPYGFQNASTYAEFEVAFRKFLSDRQAKWTRGELAAPSFLSWVQSRPRPQVPACDKRILFLMPRYIQNSTNFIETDFEDHLLKTAESAGALVKWFATDRCAYPDLGLNVENAKEDLGRLSEVIAEFKPDLVVVDANYIPTSESLNPSFLDRLKCQFGFRIVSFIGDAWGRPWIAVANSWGPASDVIYHFAPDNPIEAEGQYPEKLCWDGYLVNARSFYPDQQKTLDISFVGTYTSALRPFWLASAAKVAENLRLDHRLMPHQRKAGAALTMDDYAKVLRRSRIVLNFSSRYDDHKMMTGRAWQAMTAGVLLLDEENRYTPFYFVPFVHYVPFSNQQELAFAVEFFSRNPSYAERIGAEASAFCREQYSATAIWGRLIGAAYARPGASERQDSVSTTR